jgi:hypothetical protein
MPTQSRDQAIVAILTQKIGDLAGGAAYDDEGNLYALGLSSTRPNRWTRDTWACAKEEVR